MHLWRTCMAQCCLLSTGMCSTFCVSRHAGRTLVLYPAPAGYRYFYLLCSGVIILFLCIMWRMGLMDGIKGG